MSYRLRHLTGNDASAQAMWGPESIQGAPVYDKDGAQVTPNGQTTNVAIGVYLSETDALLPGCPLPGQTEGDYYNPGVILGLTGAVGDPSSRMTEERVCAQIPIAELYEIKRSEISDQDSLVRYNAAPSGVQAAWWIILTERARSELATIATGSNSRQIRGESWPGGANQPWIGVFNVDNSNSRREQIPNQSTWDTLEISWYQHDQATGNATDASVNALDAAYADGAGNWDAVASHDPADPAWGYPPTVDPGALGTAAII